MATAAGALRYKKLDTTAAPHLSLFHALMLAGYGPLATCEWDTPDEAHGHLQAWCTDVAADMRAKIGTERFYLRMAAADRAAVGAAVAAVEVGGAVGLALAGAVVAHLQMFDCLKGVVVPVYRVGTIQAAGSGVSAGSSCTVAEDGGQERVVDAHLAARLVVGRQGAGSRLAPLLHCSVGDNMQACTHRGTGSTGTDAPGHDHWCPLVADMGGATAAAAADNEEDEQLARLVFPTDPSDYIGSYIIDYVGQDLLDRIDYGQRAQGDVVKSSSGRPAGMFCETWSRPCQTERRLRRNMLNRAYSTITTVNINANHYMTLLVDTRMYGPPCARRLGCACIPTTATPTATHPWACVCVQWVGVPAAPCLSCGARRLCALCCVWCTWTSRRRRRFRQLWSRWPACRNSVPPATAI